MRPSIRRRSIRQIFVVPLIVAILSAIGLVSALVGNGVWDGVSWSALLIPIALCAYFLFKA
jgi:hypothetical protein